MTVDDNHDEGDEWFTIVLYRAEDATIGDGETIATIRNTDPLPDAWFARFGRAVADQALEGITARIEAAGTPTRVSGFQGSLAGRPIGSGASQRSVACAASPDSGVRRPAAGQKTPAARPVSAHDEPSLGLKLQPRSSASSSADIGLSGDAGVRGPTDSATSPTSAIPTPKAADDLVAARGSGAPGNPGESDSRYEAGNPGALGLADRSGPPGGTGKSATNVACDPLDPMSTGDSAAFHAAAPATLAHGGADARMAGQHAPLSAPGFGPPSTQGSFGAPGFGQYNGIGGLGSPVGQNPGGAHTGGGYGPQGAGGVGPAYGPGMPYGSSMVLQQLLTGSHFVYTGKEDGNGGILGFWGRGAHSTFNGEQESIRLDGGLSRAMLGADYARGEWLFGVALTQSLGDGDYSGRDSGSGTIESTLTAATPYAAWDVSERLSLWGAASHGVGRMTLSPGASRSGRHSFASAVAPSPHRERLRADIGWSMAALGVRSELFGGSGGGSALALTSDALWARTTSSRTEGMMGGAADVSRVRLGIKGRWTFRIGGGAIAPKLEAGLRHDGGDAETGFGVEVGGGVAWTHPELGLQIDLEGRTLIAHEDGAMGDRGFSVSLAYDLKPDSARSLSLTLRQDAGGLPAADWMRFSPTIPSRSAPAAKTRAAGRRKRAMGYRPSASGSSPRRI